VWVASLELGYASEKLPPKDLLSPPPLAFWGRHYATYGHSGSLQDVISVRYYLSLVSLVIIMIKKWSLLWIF